MEKYVNIYKHVKYVFRKARSFATPSYISVYITMQSASPFHKCEASIFSKRTLLLVEAAAALLVRRFRSTTYCQEMSADFPAIAAPAPKHDARC